VQGTGAFSSAVTWGATGGTINSSGVFTPAGAGTATITATSTQDATKSGSAPVTVAAQTEGSCNITAAGTIQADGSLGGNPLLGDVYQIQGTITANYLDDDEANNGYVTFTAPDGHTVNVGMFLLNAHANGTNTYAVRVAAGFESKGVWSAGTWTWSMNYSDRAGNTCTATGSFTVQAAFANSQGFLRQYLTTNNLITDGNGQLFSPTGQGWYYPYYNGSIELYNTAAIPALAYVTVSGTAVTYVSGIPFNTTAQASGIYAQLYICPALPNCTVYENVTINSSTSITLGSSGGTLTSATPAYLGWSRDLSIGHHALGYQATLPQAAQFAMSWGTNFTRFAGDQNATVESGAWGGSGYNDYNWSTASGGGTQGIPGVDLWFAAAHSAGMHIMWGGPQKDTMAAGPCPGYTCTTNEQLSLENFYAMASARWGAFYDVLELENEASDVPQTWVDIIGNTLTNGVTGIAGGNPADPYGHFITNSYFPSYSNEYISPYGPGTSAPDDYLNFVDMWHLDGPYATPVFDWMSYLATSAYGGCPGVTYNPNGYVRFNGEAAVGIGIAPASESANAPGEELNSPRINDGATTMNQCGGGYFNSLSDQVAFNSASPLLVSSWYVYGSGRVNLHNFLTGLDPSAAPITLTLGGGCGSGACAYAALGSSNHVRIMLNSATGNATTGVPNTVTSGTVTFNVPQPNMTGKWWNTASGSIISTVTSSASAGTQTFTAPSFNVDIWFQLDP
jgi:hypothetical protein